MLDLLDPLAHLDQEDHLESVEKVVAQGQVDPQDPQENGAHQAFQVVLAQVAPLGHLDLGEKQDLVVSEETVESGERQVHQVPQGHLENLDLLELQEQLDR